MLFEMNITFEADSEEAYDRVFNIVDETLVANADSHLLTGSIIKNKLPRCEAKFYWKRALADAWWFSWTLGNALLNTLPEDIQDAILDKHKDFGDNDDSTEVYNILFNGFVE